MNIPYDPVKFIEAGIKAEAHGDVMRVILPSDPGAFYVHMIGNDLEIVPERSAAHRQLLEALGMEQTWVKPEWMGK